MSTLSGLTHIQRAPTNRCGLRLVQYEQAHARHCTSVKSRAVNILCVRGCIFTSGCREKFSYVDINSTGLGQANEVNSTQSIANANTARNGRWDLHVLFILRGPID